MAETTTGGEDAVSLWRRLFRRKASGAAPRADDDMLAVLAELGVPLQRTPTDPTSALMSGAAKAAIYHAHRQLRGGDPAGALATIEGLLETSEFGRHPSSAPIAAAGFYLRGQAHEANGHPLPARIDYETALKISPTHQPARLALDRIAGDLRG